MKLPTIEHDKAMHVIYGAAAFAIGHTFAVVLGYAPYALHAGAALTAAVGISKEVIDYLRNRRARKAGASAPHSVELADAAATLGGGVLVALPTLITGAVP